MAQPFRDMGGSRLFASNDNGTAQWNSSAFDDGAWLDAGECQNVAKRPLCEPNVFQIGDFWSTGRDFCLFGVQKAKFWGCLAQTHQFWGCLGEKMPAENREIQPLLDMQQRKVCMPSWASEHAFAAPLRLGMFPGRAAGESPPHRSAQAPRMIPSYKAPRRAQKDKAGT